MTRKQIKTTIAAFQIAKLGVLDTNQPASVPSVLQTSSALH